MQHTAGGERRWPRYVVAAVATTVAFGLYLASAAPGLTWAHQGADGGELLAAAVANGVPHPPGYPLYMLLLQGWLAGTGLLLPESDLAWRGNLFSAACAAASVGFTALVCGHLVRRWPLAWLWSVAAGLAWALSPLLWQQAVITEVYALHVLLVALLGWAVLVHAQRRWLTVLVVALGVAHHLTFLLLLPAAFYAIWMQSQPRRTWLTAATFLLGVLGGMLFYLRVPLVAGQGPPPVNWGFADNWAGFWWLVSGAAYRGYLFASPAGSIFGRLAGWAYVITTQYTPVGLAIALVGLAWWDRHAPPLRTFSLLWLVPVSIYALVYYTRDSEIYLLPVVWLMALWLAVGLAALADELLRRQPRHRRASRLLLATLLGAALVSLLYWRWPEVALAHDDEARRYLARVGEVLEPGSIVVAREDRETFALWYGAWAGGELATAAPGLIPVNDSLLQFDWYRRLLTTLHPQVVGVGESVPALVEGNRHVRAIYFVQVPEEYAADQFVHEGPLWRFKE